MATVSALLFVAMVVIYFIFEMELLGATKLQQLVGQRDVVQVVEAFIHSFFVGLVGCEYVAPCSMG